VDNVTTASLTTPAPAVAGLGVFVVLIGILRLVILLGWRDGGRRRR
jgi:hypothetical protein